MEFIFPDSQDQVSPFFDFETEEFPKHRVRQRDDAYAHEILATVPYDGLLVSKAMVDGSARGTGKYSMPQSQRLYRMGVRKFFRLGGLDHISTMGDCGAFTYADQDDPAYSVTEVIDFYEGVGFDRGVSMDHIVFGYLNQEQLQKGIQPEAEWVRRRNLTIELAAEFMAEVKARNRPFEPIGAAHGWDAESYCDSVAQLERIGFQRISLGGMVPLRTSEIQHVLAAVGSTRKPETQLHLLGVTRIEHVHEFARNGVTSFDSTTPLRQAFKDERKNYYATGGIRHAALRVPQVDGNPSLKRRIAAGLVDQPSAVASESTCLAALRAFDRGEATVEECVDYLAAYESLWDGKKDRSAANQATLEAAPWKNCECGICDTVGIETIIFRGSERNKRRGFHNLTVFRQDLDRLIAAGAPTLSLLPDPI